ncbi:MAG: hypothetical protein ACRETL_16465, partial [Gammaproteobacteria bacterium]
MKCFIEDGGFFRAFRGSGSEALSQPRDQGEFENGDAPFRGSAVKASGRRRRPRHEYNRYVKWTMGLLAAVFL